MRTLIGPIVVAVLLSSGCSGPTPHSQMPRYHMQVIGEQGYAVVYRLDTATGEIETFFATSPAFIEQKAGQQATSMLREFMESMTFTPGAKLTSGTTR